MCKRFFVSFFFAICLSALTTPHSLHGMQGIFLISHDEASDATKDLFAAIRKGSLEKLEEALENGANAREQYRLIKPLHLAIKSGNLVMVERIILAGGYVNSTINNGLAPLHLVSWYSEQSAEAVDLLQRHGAKLEQKDDEGQTPLHHAAMQHNLTITTRLLEAGAQVNARNNLDETPLHKAITAKPKGKLNPPGMRALVVKKLIAYNADLEAKDKEGKTPLRKARELLLANLASSSNMTDYSFLYGEQMNFLEQVLKVQHTLLEAIQALKQAGAQE